ncbi:hypothetical protein FACS1894116_10480 [Betaproteobacteria bacterium]|nr:hypothetical protein FACS1894116_10480 [Betaproteobacteria bacterium]
MKIFDLYRSGYKLGNLHGKKRERRRAGWELFVTHHLVWLPGTDSSSFISGYYDGYRDGVMFASIIGNVTGP